MNRSLKNRDISIDALRGLLIILVVFNHIMVIPHWLTDFYIVGFFFISGYLYRDGKCSYLQTISKKAKRLLLPYFANSFILLGVFIIVGSLNTSDVVEALKGIFYSRYYIHPNEEPIMDIIGNSPLWYLTAFFTTFLLFHAIIDYVKKDNYYPIVFILLSLSILLSFLPILLPWSLDMVPFFCVCMILGHWFKQYEAERIINNDSLLDGSFKLAVLFICYTIFSYSLGGNFNLSVREYNQGVLGWGGGKYSFDRRFWNNCVAFAF